LPPADPFPAWLGALERRHLADLTFQEVRRALQALSECYVERRDRLAAGAALEGSGKRAAFALFYGPIHFLLAREVLRSLGAASPPPARIVDLGCGTGAAGAAWALEAGGAPSVLGIDRSGWAAHEAAWTYRALGVRGTARRGDVDRTPLPGREGAVLLAFTVNELEEERRPRLLARLLAAAARGARVAVMEPIARRGFPWWEDWSAAFREAGGRDDSWRFPARLPGRLALLDRAAGMDHRELTGRSLWLPGRPG
jgi:SAM-dependent methyltransferase